MSRKQVTRLNKLGIKKDLPSLIRGIIVSKERYINNNYKFLIDKIYKVLFEICEYNNSRINKKIINNYVSKYINLCEAYQPYINNIRGEMHPFYKSLGKCWFTNKFFGTLETNLLSQQERYINNYRFNRIFKPMFDYLDNKLDKNNLYDIQIESEVFNTIPGETIESKKEILVNVLKLYATFESPLLKFTKDCVELLNGDKDNYRMVTNIKITNMANNAEEPYRYKLRISGRMTNDSCSIHKNERYLKFKAEGIEGRFDIMGTVFTIARSLNFHIPLDLEYDIKQELADLGIIAIMNGIKKVLERKDYKQLLYYIFFALDEDTAWNYYKNRYNASYFKEYEEYNIDLFTASKKKIDKNVPIIEETAFRKVYRWVQFSTGGTTKHRNNIFIIESAIEALVVHDIKKNGFAIKNVYDCFYWDESEITENYVRKMIIGKASIVFSKYYELTSYRSISFEETTTNQICS